LQAGSGHYASIKGNSDFELSNQKEARGPDQGNKRKCVTKVVTLYCMAQAHRHNRYTLPAVMVRQGTVCTVNHLQTPEFD
jgi:hypothetical protein